MNNTLITKLASGRIQMYVSASAALYDVSSILDIAFPEDREFPNGQGYYYGSINDLYWVWGEDQQDGLPVYDFEMFLRDEPINGDPVTWGSQSFQCFYVGQHPTDPTLAVVYDPLSDLLGAVTYDILVLREEVLELTIEEIAEKLGVKKLKIKES